MQGGKQNMNLKSIEKSKLKNAENQARTLNLIIAKIVSKFWNLIHDKTQKFKDTICRCINILLSKLERIRTCEIINQEKLIDSKDKQRMLIMLGSTNEVGGEC